MLKEWALIGYHRKLQNINLEKDVHGVLQKVGKILFHKIPIGPTGSNRGYYDNDDDDDDDGGGGGKDNDDGITYEGLLHSQTIVRLIAKQREEHVWEMFISYFKN
jgi:hypothetical protein